MKLLCNDMPLLPLVGLIGGTLNTLILATGSMTAAGKHDGKQPQ